MFKADERFRKSIEKAIDRAHNGKMAGNDGFFVEMRKIDQNYSSSYS